MIQIEQVGELPQLNWSETALFEMHRTGMDLISQTDVMWKIGELAVCGYIWQSFFQPPWMWFVLARGAKFRDLIDLRALARTIPTGTLTGIREGARVERRFAEFYGFVDQGVVVGDYRLFRKMA